MPKSIEVLDEKEAHVLRSQSILVSFGSVVAELLANAIDSGATEVSVKLDLESLGVWVKDNGGGIDSSNLQNVGKRHHTSKLTKLQNIEAFGYRGEAISSLMAVARVTVLSKVDGNEPCCISNKASLSQINLGAFALEDLGKSGTLVVVSNLFHNVPVRRRQWLQRKPQMLKDEIRDVLVEALARCPTMHLSVLFGIEDKDSVTYNGLNNYGSILQRVHGTLSLSESVSVQYKDYHLEGVIAYKSLPWNRLQYVFVNQRRYHNLDWAIRSRTPSGSPKKRLHPIYLLGVECKLHPMDVLSRTLSEPHVSIISQMVKEVVQNLEVQKTPSRKRPSESATSPSKARTFNESPADALSPTKARHIMGSECPTTPTKVRNLLQRLQAVDVAADDLAPPMQVSRTDLEDSHILKQIANKFILIKSGNVLLAADQHACDERVRVEDLQREFIELVLDPGLSLQYPLQQTISFPIAAKECSLFKQHASAVSQFGITYYLEDRVVKVTHLPMLIHDNDCNTLRDLLLQYLYDLESMAKRPIGPTEDWFLLVGHLPTAILDALNSKACRAAVKFGNPLTQTEMAYLVGKLAACHIPFLCAHGRPSIVPLVDLQHID